MKVIQETIEEKEIKLKAVYQKLPSIRPGHPIEALNSNSPLIFQFPFINNIWSLLSMLRHNVLHCKTRCRIFKLLKCEFTKCMQVINIALLLIICNKGNNPQASDMIRFSIKTKHHTHKKGHIINPPMSGASRTAALNCEFQQHGMSLEHWHPMSMSQYQLKLSLLKLSLNKTKIT